MPIGGMGGLNGRFVNTRTEADAKMWRRYLDKVTPKRREWSTKAHRVWLAAFGVVVLATVVLGALNAAG